MVFCAEINWLGRVIGAALDDTADILYVHFMQAHGEAL